MDCSLLLISLWWVLQRWSTFLAINFSKDEKSEYLVHFRAFFIKDIIHPARL
jgi:hypothetical protein